MDGVTARPGATRAESSEDEHLRVVKNRTFVTHLGCVVNRHVTYDARSGHTLEAITMSHPLSLREVASSRVREVDADAVFDRIARWRR